VNVVVIGDVVHMTMSVHDLSQSRMLEIVVCMLLLSRDHSAAVKGGATIFKVGVQVFDPPTFGTWGGHKTGYYSFHYCNYDV